MPPQITAPKREPAGHAESYNPPDEYLFDEEEKNEWEEDMDEDKDIDYQP